MPYAPSNEWQVCLFHANKRLGLRLVVDMPHARAAVMMLEKLGVPFVREEELGLSCFCVDPAAYEDIQDAIEQHKTFRSLIGPLHPEWLGAIDKQDSALYKRALTPDRLKRLWETVPKHIVDVLQWYQRVGVEFLWGRRDRGMLADEMGLGKTLQAITFLLSSTSRALFAPENQHDEFPVLICVPNQEVRQQWKAEWLRWSQWPNPDDVCTFTNGDEARQQLTALLETRQPRTKAISKASRTRADSKPSRTKRAGNPPQKACVNKQQGRKRARETKEETDLTNDEKNGIGRVKRTKVHLPRVYVITYSLLIRPDIFDMIKRIQFPSIVYDESHNLKTYDSKCSTFCRQLAAQPSLQRLVLLSGTPGSKAFEYFPPLKMLCPKLISTWWKRLPPRLGSQTAVRQYRVPEVLESYAHRYCDPKPKFVFLQGQRSQTWEFGGTIRLGELRALLSLVLIRRRKRDVLPTLDAVERHRIVFRLSPEQELNNELDMAKLQEYEAKNNAGKKREHMMNIFNKRLPVLKRPIVERLVRDLLLEGPLSVRRHVSAWLMPHLQSISPLTHLVASYLPQKTIIFAYHIETLQNIVLMLDELKIPCVWIFGQRDEEENDLTRKARFKTISKKERTLRIHRFKTDDTVQVAVLSITALSAGVNLQEAQSVIFAELFWTPEVVLQAESRCHRLTSVDLVRAFYPCVAKSLDDFMWENLRHRQLTSLSLLDYDPERPEQFLARDDAFPAHVTHKVA